MYKMSLLVRVFIFFVPLILVISCSRGDNFLLNHHDVRSQGAVKTELDVLNQSLDNMVNEDDVLGAINHFEIYVNKKTNNRITISSAALGNGSQFSLENSLKKKLAQKEMEFRIRKMSDSSRVLSLGASLKDEEDDLDFQTYFQEKEEELLQGLSSKDMADMLNDFAASVVADNAFQRAMFQVSNFVKGPITDSNVEIIMDALKKILPNLNPDDNGRVTPLQALVIGYSVFSNDDGNQEDGEVDLYASQEQTDAFVNLLVE